MAGYFGVCRNKIGQPKPFQKIINTSFCLKSEVRFAIPRCEERDTLSKPLPRARHAYMSAVYASTVPYSIVPTEAGAKAVVRAEAETKANAAADALLAEEAAEAVAAATSALCKGKGRSKGKGKSSGKP